MRKQLTKKTFEKSLLSVLILGVIILLAIGSNGSRPKVKKEDLGGGYVRQTTAFNDVESTVQTVTGRIDKHGIRDGLIRIETKSVYSTCVEEINYRNRVRNGMATTTWGDRPPEYTCYTNGVAYPCSEWKKSIKQATSAYEVLAGKHPWYKNTLFVFGFDNEYVGAYLDTLETILDEFGDDPLEFDIYYEDAVDSLTYTPYDSIIQLNYILSDLQGEEEVKQDEFRMANIDRYRSEGETTFSILQSIYPGYLQSISELGVSDGDFERFCHVNDSLMDGDDALYGALDREDIFFVDSVDTRLYRAMVYILSYEDTASSALKSIQIKAILNYKHNIRSLYREIPSLLLQTPIDSTIQNSAGAVLYFILLKYYQGDMLYRSVKEAWLNERQVVQIPTVMTDFSGNSTATSANLTGRVLEDGGAEVTSRGIAWAVFYNPTLDDQTESSGTGVGTFEVTLNNLIEGKTYYARSFATNSAGTAYGNCVEFTAGAAVGISEKEWSVQDIHVYPNPASALATFSFNLGSSGNTALTIINLKGQAVHSSDLGSLPPGDHQVELEVSRLQNGIYNCQLTHNGTVTGTCKLFILH
jgi:hypothetical protein